MAFVVRQCDYQKFTLTIHCGDDRARVSCSVPDKFGQRWQSFDYISE